MAFDYRNEYQRYKQYYLNLRRFYQKPIAKVSFFVLLSFFTVVFFSVFAIRPTITTIGELIRSIEDKRNIDASLNQKVKALDALQTTLVSIQGDLGLIYISLPLDSKLGRLMQEFEYLGLQQQVHILSVSFNPIELTDSKASGKVKTELVNFSISVGGDFDNLAEYIKTLERLDRVLKINEIQFISGAYNLKQKGISVVIDLKGEAYFLKETEESAS